MALLHFPAHADYILGNGRPFFEALLRFRLAPSFRKTPIDRLQARLEHDLCRAPLVAVGTGPRVPEWLDGLAAARPLILFSQWEEVIDRSAQMDGVCPVLLKGQEDLRRFYVALRRMCAARSESKDLDRNVRLRLRELAERDLLQHRSRLNFIPPQPLPQPDHGRSAVYLLNRLSNNVEQPALQAEDTPATEWQFPELLRHSLRASAALASVEEDRFTLEDFKVDRGEVEAIHSMLLEDGDETEQFRAFLTLGQRVANRKASSSRFLTVPTPRKDFVRGRVPPGVTLETNHKAMVKSGLKALRDFVKRTQSQRPTGDLERQRYDRARETLLLEQRFLACETAYLASSVGAIPWQLGVGDNSVYSAIQDLTQAIGARSRKVSRLFRNVESRLATMMPPDLLSALATGQSTVHVLSDLPIEWTMIDGWPLCLTRPVSRIPMAVTDWDVLVAAIEAPARINVNTPERVLVLDLIARDDPIRSISDIFASVSSGLSQNYTYASPVNGRELREAIQRTSAEIVVLDTHGEYRRVEDEVLIGLPGGPVPLDELLPDGRVPPVWILSACDTSVTGCSERMCRSSASVSWSRVCDRHSFTR